MLVRGGIVFDGAPSDASPRPGTTPRMSILDADFMRLAFAAGAIVGVLAPAVGFFLVQRRMSLIGDGIGHVAFAGVAAGYLLGISPVLTALVASVVGAIADRVAARRRRQAAGDQALALVFYTGIAAGVVLISAAGALNANLFAFLFGSILTVTRGDLAARRRSSASRASRSSALLYRALVAVALDEEAARVSGLPVAVLNVAARGARRGDDRGLDARRRHPADRGADGAPRDRRQPDRLEHPLDDPARDRDRPRLGLRRPHGLLLRESRARRDDRPWSPRRRSWRRAGSKWHAVASDEPAASAVSGTPRCLRRRSVVTKRQPMLLRSSPTERERRSCGRLPNDSPRTHRGRGSGHRRRPHRRRFRCALRLGAAADLPCSRTM